MKRKKRKRKNQKIYIRKKYENKSGKPRRKH